MKYISTILSIIALGLIGVLFLTQSKQFDQLKKHVEGEKLSTGTGFKIAYFDLDSLQAHYDYFKDVQDLAKSKENAMNLELSSMDRGNQKKIEEWRQKGNTMTQAEGEQAQQEYQKMQQQFAGPQAGTGTAAIQRRRGYADEYPQEGGRLSERLQ
jgi:outer membrane protein